MGKSAITVGIVFTVLLIAGVYFRNLYNPISHRNTTNQIRISTSFYPLYYFASRIGGEKTDVFNLTPSGAEPHDYELTTNDITTIESSDLLIINGGGLEPWKNNILANIKDSRVRVVDTGEGIITDQPSVDPHIWLDPQLASQQVDRITKALVEADGKNAKYYSSNAQALKSELITLDREFESKLKQCKDRTIVTSHAAYGYVASRYQLTQVAISGLTPDEEPSPRQLAKIADFAKSHKVRYIFFETLVSPRLAETVATEIGAQTVVYNPLEGISDEDQKAGHNYFTVQRENLSNLQLALSCI